MSGHGFLVVVDDTPESRLALRYAARAAQRAEGKLTLLSVVPPPEFVQWGGVQKAMQDEAVERAETVLAAAADDVAALGGLLPSASVRMGKPIEEVQAALRADPDLHVLVLGAAHKGPPGPLVSFFSGEAAGGLRCLVVIVPGGLDAEAIDRLA